MTRAFGDDQVETRADGSRVLICSQPKGWHARSDGSQTRAEHPGTAVRWDDAMFEVVEATPLFERGVRYVLVAWDVRHAIRVVRDYDEAAEAARRCEAAEHRSGAGKRRLSIFLAALAGHLPARVQERMEGGFGAPARAMTVASALPLFVIGVLGILGRLIALTGGGEFLPAFAAHPIVCAWLAVESGIRLGVAFLLAEPIGSVAGTIAWEAWRLARGAPAEKGWRGAPATSEQAARDRFHMLEPLLALLSADEQEVLERRFGFDPLLWGRRSVRLLAFIGGINAFLSYGHWLAGGSTFEDLIWFVGGTALSIEQFRRRRVIASGRPAGSVLGGLVRPMARRLLVDM